MQENAGLTHYVDGQPDGLVEVSAYRTAYSSTTDSGMCGEWATLPTQQRATSAPWRREEIGLDQQHARAGVHVGYVWSEEEEEEVERDYGTRDWGSAHYGGESTHRERPQTVDGELNRIHPEHQYVFRACSYNTGTGTTDYRKTALAILVNKQCTMLRLNQKIAHPLAKHSHGE